MEASVPAAAPERIVIASRESRLALWQAEHVRARLLQCYPQARVEILGMTTRGDQILDRPLAEIGGKGLFVKELEVAMLEGRADLAVHSLKDVPMEMPEGFVLSAVLEREDPCDAFVSNRFAGLEVLPAGAVVGTSSLRRAAQLRATHPQLVIEALRGNLDTRLRKLDEGRYDAIILAAAGLKRLGLGARIRAVLTPEASLPAAGQGALGIEIRSGRPELAAWLAPLEDPATRRCVEAEREFARRLGGSCQLPLGAFAEIDDATLRLRGFVAMPDGTRMLAGEVRGELRLGDPGEAAGLGRQLAEDLIARGGAAIIAAAGGA